MLVRRRAETVDFEVGGVLGMPGHIDLLEEYLRTAPIIYQGNWPLGGAHQNKMELILEGGVGAIAKPADWADGPRAVQCEHGAWLVAKLLGWADLLAVTVLREIRSAAGDQLVQATVQIAWPRSNPDFAAPFEDTDVWRAAIFDFVIDQSDRGGHNWLAVPGDAPVPMLKLVDHGYSFGAPGRPFQSSFFDQKRGQPLPDYVIEGLRQLLVQAPQSGLRDLIPEAEFDKMVFRVEHLLQEGRLERP